MLLLLCARFIGFGSKMSIYLPKTNNLLQFYLVIILLKYESYFNPFKIKEILKNNN